MQALPLSPMHRVRSYDTRIFYRSEYLSEVSEQGYRHVFDTQKARRICEALLEEDLISRADLLAARPLTEEDLLLVHTPAYLEEIRRPATLARLLLLDPAHPWDGRLLQPFLYAAGGTLAAARLAADRNCIGFNLGGGYHHAQADKAEGFCAIADVAIAVRDLQDRGAATHVLIVDLDCHHGNGNAEIFSNDETVFTFSMHNGNWCWITKRNHLDVELPTHAGDEIYLEALRAHLPRILDTFRPDFVAYVAGSDPFVGDSLGDLDVSEQGMLWRDRFVTEQVRRRAIPLLVVTAGGYGVESWRIHFNYLRWLLRDAGLS